MGETREEDRRAAALDYMHVMLGQLRAMAERDSHDMLAYLIGMAHLEAAEKARGARAHKSRGTRETRPPA